MRPGRKAASARCSESVTVELDGVANPGPAPSLTVCTSRAD